MSDAVAQAADREGKYLTFSLAGEEYGNGIKGVENNATASLTGSTTSKKR